MEEYWYHQQGDAITGWFRWKREDFIFLYLFILLQQIDNKVMLKLKHFDSKLVAWDEKETWTKYRAWSSKPNLFQLKATDPKHTPLMVYELQES